MQLRLEFIDEKGTEHTKRLPAWEKLEETARLEVATRLAHLIARMLVRASRGDGER
ncbi:hypothetical protein [Azospirillum himalayense]|uniref:Uncharacterized protein n=1 Tax=Azospirillum himalayense TaxID=654847 RepID=A0ABW0G9T0_9PROT